MPDVKKPNPWRYAVMTDPGVFAGFETLVAALEYRERVKAEFPCAMVWEPLAMSAAERARATEPGVVMDETFPW